MSPQKPVKKTIYVDADEEITGVIDKLRSSSEPIVALVVPKSASVFMSIVNMKLLKRAADQSKKKLVLVTSNQSVLPLAGSVGMHVAANPNAKPYIPSAPETAAPSIADSDEQSIEINSASEPAVDSEAAASPIGPKNSITPKAAGAATIAVDAAKAPKVKKAKGPKLKVPDFKKFRTLLIAGIALLLVLIVGGYWALAIAPKATVTLRGETDTKNLSFKIGADTAAKTLDEEKMIVPSMLKEIKKTETEKVAATGQKDKGEKAKGTIKIYNCNKDDKLSDVTRTVPAGTGVSASGFTFILQTSVEVEPSSFNGNNCSYNRASDAAVVVAQNPGDQYNISEKQRSYSVAGFSSMIADGSSMTGGTSQVVKVVANSDIENAKQKLSAKQVGATEELKASLNAEGYTGLVDTFAAANGNYVPTPAVDSEANEVIVSVQTTYTMLGVKKDDLKKLVETKAAKDAGIDTNRQSILSNGLDKATFQLGAKAGTSTDVTVKTDIIAGPQIDQNAIKSEIAGKKRGVAEQSLANRPGIKEVRIDTSPFWNYSVPKKTNKINFVVEDTDGAQVNP